jgi:hypothetical protein
MRLGRSRRVALATLVLAALVAGCRPALPKPVVPATVVSLAEMAPGLDPTVLTLALHASACAARQALVPSLAVLTVIDYSRPSTEPRLWVIDLTTRRLVHRELVAHGRGSGELWATAFSNVPGSKQSSLGLFVTGDTYVGRHGRSLRLIGLEPGVNDNAVDRMLVMHAAEYVSDTVCSEHGRLGRSLGCPALRPEIAQTVIDEIRGGTPVFAYYPDRAWLTSSRFLTGACAVE